jgi:hypothetical protein
MPLDYHVIIVWDSDPDLIKIIHDRFDQYLVIKKKFHLTGSERYNKISQIYHPGTIREDDARCVSSSEITVFLLKMLPKYKYYYRSEGFRLCNSEILEFKLQTRQTYHYNSFHCSDNIEETKQALRALEMYSFIPPYSLVKTDNLYHFIHEGRNYFNAYDQKKYKIIPIKDSPVVRYLIDRHNESLVGDIFTIRTDTVDYYSGMHETFDQSHIQNEILTVKYQDKFVVVDGMHRSSVHYFNGDRHIFVKEEQNPQLEHTLFNYLDASNFQNKIDNSHIENLHQVLYALNNANIQFIIIRGYDTMPFKANTDLDIIIYPPDYQKFLSIMETFVNNKQIEVCHEKMYHNFHQPLWYRSYKTTGAMGETYQLDTYNTAFFFKSEQDGLMLHPDFIEHIFNNKIKMYNFYIPDRYSEMVLLLCRVFIDKQGNWSEKHQIKFNNLINSGSFDIAYLMQFVNEAFKCELHQLLPLVENLLTKLTP